MMWASPFREMFNGLTYVGFISFAIVLKIVYAMDVEEDLEAVERDIEIALARV